MNTETREAIDLYREIEKETIDKVIGSGLEHVSIDECSWTVMRNDAMLSNDVHISLHINGEHTTLIIPFILLLRDVRGQDSIYKQRIIIADKIKAKLIEHIANHMAQRIFMDCASKLIPR